MTRGPPVRALFSEERSAEVVAASFAGHARTRGCGR